MITAVFGASAAILLLLASCCPANIPWFVVPVILDAVEGKPGWSLTNVVKKGHEIVAPLVANFDAALPIIGVLRCFGIMATLFHAAPRLVFRPRFVVRCCAVPESRILQTEFTFQAAAGFGFTAKQVGTSGNYCSSALTGTQPACRSSVIAFSDGSMKNCQQSKGFTDYIGVFHGVNILQHG